ADWIELDLLQEFVYGCCPKHLVVFSVDEVEVGAQSRQLLKFVYESLILNHGFEVGQRIGHFKLLPRLFNEGAHLLEAHVLGAVLAEQPGLDKVPPRHSVRPSCLGADYGRIGNSRSGCSIQPSPQGLGRNLEKSGSFWI